MSTVHWDDIEVQDATLGPMSGRWRDLGTAAGSHAVGANRIEVSAGHQATPLHAHGGEEELFYVLAGGGFSVTEQGACAIAAGDAILYPAEGPAHTVVAGDGGLDVLAFGPRQYSEAVRFPRIAAVKVGGMVLDARAEGQWELEAGQGLVEVVPGERPATVRNVAEVPGVDFRGRATGWFLGRDLGAQTTHLNRVDLKAGAEAAPPHCHSAESELFVVLDGDGVLLLITQDGGEQEHPVRAGSIVARPAGTGVAHGFRAGETGLSLLAYSDRDPNDMCFYPRSGKVALRGLGVIFRPDRVPFWD
jgi:uncharacterized cupin superfamily protein